MGISERMALYHRLEEIRSRPLIVYVTSQRPNVPANMAQDVIPEFIDQLQNLPDPSDNIDILIESHGGDPLVAWRIMSLIRDRINNVCILIPYSAFSAATLLALGGDEIVMGRHGCLGPIDPQMHVIKKDGQNQNFAYQDITAYLDFVREEAGITEQVHLEKAFQELCKQVEPSTLGVARRASSLSVTIAEKLLQMHTSNPEEKMKAGSIAKRLNESYFSHGHALGRKEAKDIGLPIVDAPQECEGLLWNIHKDIENDLQFRKPYNPLSEFLAHPHAAPYLTSPPPLNLPPQVTPQIAVQILQQYINSQLQQPVPRITIPLTHALVESSRLTSAYQTVNEILVQRTLDLQFNVKSVQLSGGWSNIPIPTT